MDQITTFPNLGELDKARHFLDRLSLAYRVLSPHPAYARVGVEGLVMDQETRQTFSTGTVDDVVCSGWVDYCEPKGTLPNDPPADFEEDHFGRCAVMVMTPCVADSSKIRLIVHVSGNLAPVFPFLNAEMPQAMLCPETETLTFMDEHRLISLYPQRIALAKIDDLVDAWRVLEKIRCRTNAVWSRRANIQPLYERRKKPSAIEIYKRLPKTNCGTCGEKTCLAFALRLSNRAVLPSLCTPIFSGEYSALKGALLDILGLSESVGI